MKTQILKPHSDFDFPLMKSPQARRFSVANGNDHFQKSDIEMIPIQNSSYTSLKDILPASPTSTRSPVKIQRDSWKEIPIKDPLLKHAAWAYLQPMAMAMLEDDDGRFFVKKMIDKCRGLIGCVCGVVLWLSRAYFPSNSRAKVQDKRG